MIGEKEESPKSQDDSMDSNEVKPTEDQSMGNVPVKEKGGGSVSVREGAEMKGKGTKGTLTLDAIPEQEQLLETNSEESQYDCDDLPNDKEVDGLDSPSIPLIDDDCSEAIESPEDGNNNNSTSGYVSTDAFTFENELDAGAVRGAISSGYSSPEENDPLRESAFSKCYTDKDNTCPTKTLNTQHGWTENESSKKAPRRRRTSVQFADEEILPEKKTPANRGLHLQIPPPSPRRFTLGNLYEPSGSTSDTDTRRGSMPLNLHRHQLGRSSSNRKFTVVNYGNIGTDASTAVPTGKESVTVLEILEDESEPFPVPSPPISESSFALFNESREVLPIGGGRKLSVVHIDAGHLPEIDIKDTIDELDGPDNVFHDVSQNQYNASVLRKYHRHTQAMVNRGKDYSHRKRDRLVDKDGAINICTAKISKRNYSFMLDLFTTLLDLQWRWVWALFAVAFLASWFGFGLVWWGIAWLHGDFEPRTGLSPPVCVDNLNGFPSALLYSIETQHTIGYGSRALSPECPLAFIALIAQSLLGVIVQCVMAGVVFAKLAKPKNRAETIMFSKNANICLEDGDYCLVIRVGDMRRSQLVGCNLRAFLARQHVTLEGRQIPFHTSHLHVQAECEEHDQSLFLAWPTRIIHHITPDSPLWAVGEEDLLREQFEIIVVLEGTIESSGMTTQIRTSYLPSEIQWGETFLPLLTRQKSNTQVVIDYSNFNKTEGQEDMPHVSAMAYCQERAAGVIAAGVKLHRTGSCTSMPLSIASRAGSCCQSTRCHPGGLVVGGGMMGRHNRTASCTTSMRSRTESHNQSFRYGR